MPRLVGLSPASRCASALVLEESEGEVDTLKFAEPPFCLCELASGVEVGVDLVEAADHARVHP